MHTPSLQTKLKVTTQEWPFGQCHKLMPMAHSAFQITLVQSSFPQPSNPVKCAGRVVSPLSEGGTEVQKVPVRGSARPLGGSFPSWCLVSFPYSAWHLVGAQYSLAIITFLHFVTTLWGQSLSLKPCQHFNSSYWLSGLCLTCVLKLVQ